MRFCANCAKNCAKLKFRFMRNISQKILSVLRKLRKKNSAKPRKTHCVSCAKIAQELAKKICAKIAQILRKRFSHFVETLIGFQDQACKIHNLLIGSKFSWKLHNYFLLKDSCYGLLFHRLLWYQLPWTKTTGLT